MASEGTTIHSVSDTATWVAYYRKLETERPDALFKDPYAKVLVGDQGEKIAKSMGSSSRYTQWSVVIRTHIIDSFIQKLVQEGVDTVINLGAGLDTRPYRLSLPPSLRWIEVDYARVIEHKEKLLSTEKPGVQLERISMDLSDQPKRQALFAKLGTQTKKALIITEGVIPYLTEEQVASLADDLHQEITFHFWIGEYFAADTYRYFKNPKRMKVLKNAPFQFFPPEWFDFFKLCGWKAEEIRYLPEESIKLGRKIPMPLIAKFFIPFFPKEKMERFSRQMGYVLYSKIL